MKAFVYGTLKQGHGNWRRLLEGRAEFVGYGKTVDKFDMICVGFPMIFPNQNGCQVSGEVYEVDREVLRSLDRLESEGSMYDRKLQVIEMADGTTELCMLYVACGRNEKRYGRAVLPDETGTLTWKGYQR